MSTAALVRPWALVLAFLSVLVFSPGLLLGQPLSPINLIPAGVTEADFRWTGGTFFLPRWSGRGLVGGDPTNSDSPVVYVINKDGTRAEIKFRLPGASHYYIYDAAGGFDGALAVIGRYLGDDWTDVRFVSWISPDRKRQTMARLGSYVPEKVTIDSRGVIWTAGWEEQGGYPVDHRILRRYDKSCEVLGSYLPYKGDAPGLHPTNYSFLFASPDRVGWYCLHRLGYLEFSLDGTLVGRYPGLSWTYVHEITGAALSSDDLLLVSRHDYKLRKDEILKLNRGSRTWTPVDLGDPEHVRGARVLGYEGELLVTETDQQHLRFYAPLPATAKRD